MPVSNEVVKVNKGGVSIVEAQADDEAVHREDTESVEEIESQHTDTDDEFAHCARYHDAHQDIGVGFEDSLIEHKERQREDHIIIVHKQRRFISKPIAERDVARPIDESKQQKAEKGDDQCIEEEAVVAGVSVFEIRIETDDGCVGAELCQPDKECGSINKNARESDFLRRKEAGKDEESSQKAHRNPHIGYDGAFDTLSCDDTHVKGLLVQLDE